MMPQGAQLAAAGEGRMEKARVAVVPPGLLIERLVVAGEAVSLGARRDGVAHPAAAQRA